MAQYLRFDSLLTSLTPKESTWLSPAYVGIDHEGRISAISQEPAPGKKAKNIADSLVIPSFLNSHSHSFQYAMAGQAEYLPSQGGLDDFWAWREAMYHLALHVSAEELYIITKACYSEMLCAGYTEVLEFHYLHNHCEKNNFAIDLGLAQAIMKAAQDVGIGLTLVPVFYHCGDFNRPATPRQKRFLFPNVQAYKQYISDVKNMMSAYVDTRLGWGIHSLRAGTQAQIEELFSMGFSGPMHIHAAEQLREVQTCRTEWGATPIAWLKDHELLSSGMNIVHATHANKDELMAVAKAGANIVLCPATEGNLGDGLFDLEHYLEVGGSFSLGTDSQINFNPFEEMRTLDYQLRLKKQRRNVLCREPGEYSANILLDQCYRGGRKSFGYGEDHPFKVGAFFDAIVLNTSEALLSSADPNSNLSALIYGGHQRHISGVYRHGKEVVRSGSHRDEEHIQQEYKKVRSKYTEKF